MTLLRQRPPRHVNKHRTRPAVPVGMTEEDSRCCCDGITVAFIDKFAIWFNHHGERVRVRLRELRDPTPEIGLVIAILEARGVQFETTDTGELHFWVLGNPARQIRYVFNHTKNQTCCCRGVICSRVKRNQWSPKLYS